MNYKLYGKLNGKTGLKVQLETQETDRCMSLCNV